MTYTWNPFTGNFDKVGSGSGGGVVTPITDTVLALSTKVIDTTALSSFDAIEYSFSFTGGSEVRIFSSVVHQNSSGLRDVVFAKSGGLDMSFNVIVNGANAEIEIINPNAFNIDLSFLKTTI